MLDDGGQYSESGPKAIHRERWKDDSNAKIMPPLQLDWPTAV